MSCPTWLDLHNDAIIPPFGARSAPSIDPVAVMVSTDPDFRFIRANSGKGNTEPFFMSTLFTLEQGDKGISFAGPYIGAPYGVMILESLIAKGAEKIIVFGWCGSLSEEAAIGDIIIPDSALSDEGTSRNYMEAADSFPLVSPSKILTSRIMKEMELKDMPFKTGTIWTTDAIYRETGKKVDFFKKKNAIAVEMECSALFAAANFRQKEIAAVLVVSDTVSSSSWDPGFRNPAFKKGRQKGVQLILDLLRQPDF